MTQPEKTDDDRKIVDLSEYATQWFEVRQLKKDMDAAIKAYEERAGKVKKFIGDADVIVIHGREVATYPRGAFNRARFVKENPTLASKYMVKVFKNEFDEQMFAQENPALWLGYKTRSLRAKDGE